MSSYFVCVQDRSRHWMAVYQWIKRACIPKLGFWKPGIFQWRANSRTCKEFLLYFIFINLSAQEVRICSEVCFNSKWNFFSYEFSTFFYLFAKNNLQKEWRQRSNAIIFLSFFQFFSNFFKVSGRKSSVYYVILLKSAKNGQKIW